MFGRLTLEAFQHNSIITGGVILMTIAPLIVVGLLFYYRKWKWLWHEWITSLDPKKIGVMYIVVVLLMLFKGLTDAAMMRGQQAFSAGAAHGYLSADHFQQIFTAHGTTMIFFVGMGIVFGLMNLLIPLQIGARDVAFPFLNSIGFWLFAAGAVLVNLSMAIGEFSAAGWLAYPPLAGVQYNPGVGVDYWIWTLQVAGAGSLLSGINFFVTVMKMRCKGMTLMKMPLFTWSILNCLVLIMFAFPILTATLGLLSLDRMLGMHFFTPDFGGNQMMFVNLIWAWGHPEVYILVLPAFGMFSEVVSTFSQKQLFGYTSMVGALIAITFLSFIVWVHHFFTMGAGANVNAFFGVMTMIIAVPTGVKVFNWLATMYRGRIHFKTPMLWFLGFVGVFTIGGLTGVLLSVPAVDFQVHNSLFLVAHFHSTIIGGTVFGFLAGFTYLFPKIMGFTLNERIGKYAFRCWFIGFFLAFIPLYLLGLMGVTRRLDHYEALPGWQLLFGVAAIGVTLIVCGFFLQVLQIAVSFKSRKQNRDVTGDPWNGRTLEWSTSSPPPEYNFAIIPEVHDHEPYWSMKQAGKSSGRPQYEDIHMPRNTGMGLYIGAFSFLLCFGLIWHIMWLSVISIAGIIICMMVRLSDEDTEYCITAAEVEKMEAESLSRKGHV